MYFCCPLWNLSYTHVLRRGGAEGESEEKKRSRKSKRCSSTGNVPGFQQVQCVCWTFICVVEVHSVCVCVCTGIAIFNVISFAGFGTDQHHSCELRNMILDADVAVWGYLCLPWNMMGRVRKLLKVTNVAVKLFLKLSRWKHSNSSVVEIKAELRDGLLRCCGWEIWVKRASWVNDAVELNGALYTALIIAFKSLLLRQICSIASK